MTNATPSQLTILRQHVDAGAVLDAEAIDGSAPDCAEMLHAGWIRGVFPVISFTGGVLSEITTEGRAELARVA